MCPCFGYAANVGHAFLTDSTSLVGFHVTVMVMSVIGDPRRLVGLPHVRDLQSLPSSDPFQLWNYIVPDIGLPAIPAWRSWNEAGIVLEFQLWNAS